MADAPLRVLILSTMVHPDISVNLDSEKVGVYRGSAPGTPREERLLPLLFFSTEASFGYWHGESEPEQ